MLCLDMCFRCMCCLYHGWFELSVVLYLVVVFGLDVLIVCVVVWCVVVCVANVFWVYRVLLVCDCVSTLFVFVVGCLMSMCCLVWFLKYAHVVFVLFVLYVCFICLRFIMVGLFRVRLIDVFLCLFAGCWKLVCMCWCVVVCCWGMAYHVLFVLCACFITLFVCFCWMLYFLVFVSLWFANVVTVLFVCLCFRCVFCVYVYHAVYLNLLFFVGCIRIVCVGLRCSCFFYLFIVVCLFCVRVLFMCLVSCWMCYFYSVFCWCSFWFVCLPLLLANVFHVFCLSCLVCFVALLCICLLSVGCFMFVRVAFFVVDFC